ncbi:hypothetical protein B0A58_00040 [Flavobacterium branchiophilum NBRC 15030 = ATCC 35035]|uniref:Uncharacterized protein n=1 Tax=Flavobacterium branchiophilum TaxID=55197 RepID=A0A543G0I4_9FLAO|nr:hypothetical protein [Flavobacterium branchiophilum]OXA82401.1 hypothetical protein B0A58_00040 [Flavobacterium branchiophilum NBRC 15030 = ATCC 35035]TQM39581.1 hypothetical protein BC670_0385 [Flavobacterium branchiophilum]GEM56081.1 hypothetical protein FB1_23020 [Flavobacterium branchiophilum NBRC 15030 = ATCC 35035]
MNFYTIHLGQKRSQVKLRVKVKYDMFAIFPSLSFIKENNIFYVDEGNKFFDFIGDQGPLEFMSERTKSIIEKNKINGINFFPIILENYDLKYYGYVEEFKFNSLCEYDEYGDFIHGTIKVDMSSWDGKTDIFSIKDCGATVCTPRVKGILEKAKITNIEFEELSKY